MKLFDGPHGPESFVWLDSIAYEFNDPPTRWMPDGFGLLMCVLSRMSGSAACDSVLELIQNGALTAEQARWILNHVPARSFVAKVTL